MPDPRHTPTLADRRDAAIAGIRRWLSVRNGSGPCTGAGVAEEDDVPFRHAPRRSTFEGAAATGCNHSQADASGPVNDGPRATPNSAPGAEGPEGHPSGEERIAEMPGLGHPTERRASRTACTKDDLPRGHVDLVGAGPGDPELLTVRAVRALTGADVVIHDRLVSADILRLARPGSTVVAAGKEGFGPSTAQEQINALMVRYARQGAKVVRLKSGDATLFGRLDEEIEALEAAGIGWTILPGLTSASAAVAAIGQSLTRRGRNGSVRFLTAHDMDGFADQDWTLLARRDEVAAIYMGKRAARWMQGRLLMHGADPATQVTAVENASRPNQRIAAATLATLPEAVTDMSGPALLLLGLAPREVALPRQTEIAS
jgi:uroporphyrin-III C-methyltransferase